MKNISSLLYFLIFLFSILYFSSSKVNAQTYYFMNESATWKVDFHGYTIDCLGHCYEWEYYISGDTTINSNSFKKLHQKYHSLWNQQYSEGNAGAIREDSANKKVYYRPLSWNDTAEYLLYDFDLSAGDTIPYTYLYQEGPFPIVDSIDYVQIANQSHKRFWFMNQSIDPAYLIEGVGSRYGLLESLYGYSEGDLSLTCFEVGEEFLFSNYDTSYGCHVDIPLSTENIYDNSVIQVINNANDNSIIIENSTGEKLSIKLFDELGRMKLNQSSSEKKFKIKTSTIASGIYFLNCSDAVGNTLVSQKIFIK